MRLYSKVPIARARERGNIETLLLQFNSILTRIFLYSSSSFTKDDYKTLNVLFILLLYASVLSPAPSAAKYN